MGKNKNFSPIINHIKLVCKALNGEKRETYPLAERVLRFCRLYRFAAAMPVHMISSRMRPHCGCDLLAYSLKLQDK